MITGIIGFTSITSEKKFKIIRTKIYLSDIEYIELIPLSASYLWMWHEPMRSAAIPTISNQQDKSENRGYPIEI